jgi:hypothetical protein
MPGEVTRRYAEGTYVSVERSREQIERYFRRYGADEFAYGWDEEGHALVHIIVKLEGVLLRFDVPQPLPTEERFLYTPKTKRTRRRPAVRRAYVRAVRQRWRAFGLSVLAKLEAWHSGIQVFEEAFSNHILLADGRTVGDVLTPALRRAVHATRGELPPLLPTFTAEDFERRELREAEREEAESPPAEPATGQSGGPLRAQGVPEAPPAGKRPKSTRPAPGPGDPRDGGVPHDGVRIRYT